MMNKMYEVLALGAITTQGKRQILIIDIITIQCDQGGSGC